MRIEIGRWWLDVNRITRHYLAEGTLAVYYDNGYREVQIDISSVRQKELEDYSKRIAAQPQSTKQES